jgi:sugar transferase (PEP-CTERM/EpsH1 system associated)
VAGPIRILHLVDSLGKGGLENGLVNVIRALDPGRFEHVVCAIRRLGENAERLPADRVPVVCLDKKETGSRSQISLLTGAIRKYQPDIVHSRNWPAIEGVLASRWARVRGTIHSEHGLDAETTVGEPRRRIYFRRLAYELADRVVSVSSQLAEVHARRTGFPLRRITVIHNGVDSRRFAPDPGARAAFRRELGLANLFPVKDHLTLLRGFAEIAAGPQGQGAQLVIAGEGPERARLESFLSAHPGWKDRVKIIGSSDRIPELLNALDIYVLSSISEGISNSLLEAMATGLPVIVTQTGGNPEVVVDGQCGLLFRPGDFERLAAHLLALKSQADLRRELGRNARQRAREWFSIESMVQQYAQLYESFAPQIACRERAAVRV